MVDPTIREARCFVSGQIVPCIHLEIVDGSGARNRVPISVDVYRTCCDSDDQRAAQLWNVLSKVRSSGYTDSSFISMLIDDARSVGMDVMLVGWRDAYFLALGKYTVHGSTIIFRSKAPVWTGLADSIVKQGCPVVSVPPHQEWVDERYLSFIIDHKTGNLKFDQPFTTRGMIKWCENNGTPADFFLAVTHNETKAGYELIRLGLL